MLVERHDNAEGVVARPLRVLVADRPIPAGSLDGMGVSPAMRLARAGQLRGLILRIDPARPTQAHVTLLAPVAPGSRRPPRVVIGSAQKPAVSDLRLTAHRASGRVVRSLADTPTINAVFDVSFDAQLTVEPAVTADVHGGAVRNTAPYLAAVAYLSATERGQRAEMHRHESRDLRESWDQSAAAAEPKALADSVREMAGVMRQQLARVHRLVERGPRAVLLIDEHAWITLVKEDGEWRNGD